MQTQNKIIIRGGIAYEKIPPYERKLRNQNISQLKITNVREPEPELEVKPESPLLFSVLFGGAVILLAVRYWEATLTIAGLGLVVWAVRYVATRERLAINWYA